MQNADAQFKYRFYELRRDRDMTQAQFAAFLGLSRPSIGFYESGSRVPDAITLSKICRRCGCSADWLLGLGGVKSDNASEKAIGKLTGLSPKMVRWLYSQKKKTDGVATDYERFASLPISDFLNFSVESFLELLQQAHRNTLEAIADTALIRDDLSGLNDFLTNEETAPILNFIRLKLGGDIISASQKRALCIDSIVKSFQCVLESYVERRGSEFTFLLDNIRDQEGGNG